MKKLTHSSSSSLSFYNIISFFTMDDGDGSLLTDLFHNDSTPFGALRSLLLLILLLLLLKVDK
jgi:hypothetical protein